MSEIQGLVVLLVAYLIGFICGTVFALRSPRQAETFRAYTANEEPRE